jgi:hypothetical protein
MPMRIQTLLVGGAVAWMGCATPGAGPGAPLSAWDRNLATFRAAWLYREASASLRKADDAWNAGDRAGAHAALDRAKAAAAHPEMPSNPDWPALEVRLTATEARLSGAPTPSPVVAEPSLVAAPAAVLPAEPPAVTPDALAAALADLAKARAGLHGHELSSQDVEVAEKARDVLSRAVADGKDAAQVKAGDELLSAVAEDIRLAHLIADFVAGPGAAHKKGYALSQRAGGERDARRRQAALRAARDAFQDCVVDSRKMISQAPVLGRTALFLATDRTSPKKIAAACDQQQRALAKRIASR